MNCCDASNQYYTTLGANIYFCAGSYNSILECLWLSPQANHFFSLLFHSVVKGILFKDFSFIFEKIFGVSYGCVQGLLVVLCSGITPNGNQGNIKGCQRPNSGRLHTRQVLNPLHSLWPHSLKKYNCMYDSKSQVYISIPDLSLKLQVSIARISIWL